MHDCSLRVTPEVVNMSDNKTEPHKADEATVPFGKLAATVKPKLNIILEESGGDESTRTTEPSETADAQKDSATMVSRSGGDGKDHSKPSKTSHKQEVTDSKTEPTTAKPERSGDKHDKPEKPGCKDDKDKVSLLAPSPINPQPSLLHSLSASSIIPTTATTTPLPPTVLNKATLSNLNKSLKAKQKVINLNLPHLKNTTMISEMINTSPQSSVFPNNINNSSDSDLPHVSLGQPPNISTNKPNQPQSKPPSGLQPKQKVSESGTATPKSIINNPQKLDSNTVDTTENKDKPPPKKESRKEKQKKISDQASTRTDFFAAKLASAVDDVDTSDSDETFVYENNDNANNANNNATNAINHETNSIHGSINPQSIYSPSIHEIANPMDNTLGESLYSSLGLKLNSKSNATLPGQTCSQRPPSIANSFSSNHYMESLNNYGSGNNSANTTGKEKKVHPRKSISALKSDDASNTLKIYSEKSSGYHSPLSPFNDASLPQYNRQASFNENYSYDEEVEDDIDDDVSSDGELYTSRSQPPNNSDNITSTLTTAEDSDKTKSSKKNKNSSTASSKLRSTTSKLFDKKGSQPRRYSIIPDDIDIEDFDDDLIYYDNNIRFPYNGPPSTVNENTRLLNNDHKLLHYRSLNLGSKRLANTKRYVSTGQPLPSNGNVNNMFPFHTGDQGYYNDFQVGDENSGVNSPNKDLENSKRFVSMLNNSGRYDHPHLFPNNNYFFLPRKKSDEFGTGRGYCFRTLMYTFLGIFAILGTGFVMGFIFATTKDLEDVSIVSFENPIVSQDELIFNIMVKAVNRGWFTIGIEEVELDIFAKSGYLHDGDAEEWSGSGSGSVETVLLGTITNLNVPLSFPGGFFNKKQQDQIGEIRLLSPGKNLTNILSIESNDNPNNDTTPDNSAKWGKIYKHPFDLIVKGALKYNIPFGTSQRLAQVSKVGYIDPSRINK